MEEGLPQTEKVLADIRQATGKPCGACGKPLCGHEGVAAVALGYKRSLLCLPCLAGDLGRDPGTLRDGILEYVEGQVCYLQGWVRASRQEGQGDALRPACLWPA